MTVHWSTKATQTDGVYKDSHGFTLPSKATAMC